MVGPTKSDNAHLIVYGSCNNGRTLWQVLTYILTYLLTYLIYDSVTRYGLWPPLQPFTLSSVVSSFSIYLFAPFSNLPPYPAVISFSVLLFFLHPHCYHVNILFGVLTILQPSTYPNNPNHKDFTCLTISPPFNIWLVSILSIFTDRPTYSSYITSSIILKHNIPSLYDCHYLVCAKGIVLSVYF